jgi:hypothetical protein
MDRHRRIAADVGLHVRVLFCVRRRPDDVIQLMNNPSTLVIVGSRNCLWGMGSWR